MDAQPDETNVRRKTSFSHRSSSLLSSASSLLVSPRRQEQLNLLRNWIDKTRSFELIYSTSTCPYQVQMNCSLISHDLCQKLERIYSEFGKYLFRYASANAQQLIDIFQNAFQVRLQDEFLFSSMTNPSLLPTQIFDKKPNEIEEFARYSSHLAPHKKEMSNYLQSIEYFSNLFEVKPVRSLDEFPPSLSFRSFTFISGICATILKAIRSTNN